MTAHVIIFLPHFRSFAFIYFGRKVSNSYIVYLNMKSLYHFFFNWLNYLFAVNYSGECDKIKLYLMNLKFLVITAIIIVVDYSMLLNYQNIYLLIYDVFTMFSFIFSSFYQFEVFVYESKCVKLFLNFIWKYVSYVKFNSKQHFPLTFYSIFSWKWPNLSELVLLCCSKSTCESISILHLRYML